MTNGRIDQNTRTGFAKTRPYKQLVAQEADGYPGSLGHFGAPIVDYVLSKLAQEQVYKTILLFSATNV